MTRPDFWDRRESAQETVAEVSAIKGVLEPFARLEGQVDDFTVLGEFAELEGDDSSLYVEAEQTWPDLVKAIDQLELVSFLSGKMGPMCGFGGMRPARRRIVRWCGIVAHVYAGDARGYNMKPSHSAGDEAD